MNATRSKRALRIVVCTLLAATSAYTQNTGIQFTSASQSWIGHGRTLIISPSAGYTFWPFASDSRVLIEAIEGASHWVLWFKGPGESALVPGQYPDVSRYPFQSPPNSPGFDFDGEGRGNNALTASFNVIEVTYDQSGLHSFAADFTEYEENDPNRWIRGSVRFNSLIPFPDLQECRFLSFARGGSLAFQTSGSSNLHVGLQFINKLGDTNGWINALTPYWNISVTNPTMTVHIPASLSGEGRFLRLVCSTNPLPPTLVANKYEVYGGDSFSMDEQRWFDKGYDPRAYGYTFIGSATNTSTFSGAYKMYIIHTAPYNVAKVDTVRGSTGSYYSASGDGNTSNWQNIGGPEDGLFAEVGATQLDRGGFVVIDATEHHLTSLMVYVIQ